MVLARSGREIAVRKGETILEALLNASIDVSYSCEQGVCGACETKFLSGTPEHRDSVLTEAERAASEVMMVCVSRSRTERLVLDL